MLGLDPVGEISLITLFATTVIGLFTIFQARKSDDTKKTDADATRVATDKARDFEDDLYRAQAESLDRGERTIAALQAVVDEVRAANVQLWRDNQALRREKSEIEDKLADHVREKGRGNSDIRS